MAEQKKVGIYKITSPSNAIYIGQSRDVLGRIKGYKGLRCCKTQARIYNSFLKHGTNLHKFEVIHELPIDVSQDILDSYELFYWNLYKSCSHDMMNLRIPGRGQVMTQETKLKISKKLIGNKNSRPKKQKISQYTLEGVWIKDFESTTEAAEELGLKRTSISMCINGKNKRANKFIFKKNG